MSRRVKGDLKHFKEFNESRGAETGAWRGWSSAFVTIVSLAVAGAGTRGRHGEGTSQPHAARLSVHREDGGSWGSAGCRKGE